MRFESLSIENLASLSGKHLIDFSGKDLFAITGPTGSGKSTILNAITLSLYGELYKKSLHQNDLISLNSTFAATSLTFIFEGKTYQANWNARLSKKSGELLKNPQYKRTLKCEGELLDMNSSDLFGLTFYEFCQTIVLHQGEFSKFLISSPADKRQLLEKIFKMTHYSSFATQVRATLRELNYEKKMIQSNLEQLPPDLLETLQGAEKKQTQIKEKISSLRKIVKQNQDKIKHFEKALQLKELFQKKQEELSQLKHSQKQGEKTQRQNQEKLKQFVTALEDTEKKNRPQIEYLIAMQAKHAQILEEVTHLDSSLKAWKKDQTVFTQKEESLSSFHEKIKAIKTEIASMPTLSLDAKMLSKAEKDFDFHFREQTLDEKHLTIKNLKLALKTKNNYLRKVLKKRQVLGAQLCSYQLEKNRFDRLFKVLPRIEEKKYSHQTKIKDFTKLTKHKTHLLEQKEKLQAQLTENQTELDKLKKQVNMLSQATQTTLLLKSDSLEDGQCSLCDSSLNKEKLASFEKELLINKTLLEKKSNVLKEHERLQEQSQIVQKNYYQNESQLEQLASLSAPLKPFALSLFENKLQAEHQKLHDQRENEKNLIQERSQIQQEASTIIHLLRTMKEKLKQAQLSYQNANLYLQSFSKDCEKSLKQYLENQASQLSLSDQLKILNDRAVQVAGELKGQQGSLKKRHQELSARQEKVSQNKKQMETIDFKQIQILGTELETAKTHYTTFKKTFDQHQIKHLDAKSTIEEKLKTIEELKIQSKDWQERTQGLNEEKFESFLATHQSNEKMIEEGLKELAQMQEQIKFCKQKKSHFEKLQKQNLAITEVSRRQENLYLAMDGDGFRQYALSHLEKKLLYKTNAELKLLCQGRYELVMTETGKDYLLVDRFMGSKTRKIATLSGGEIFLVSLCMALGLSEMAKGSNHLESFFIDEGFGTLDDVCLEKIFDTLFELSLRGKQVGIISHIDKLTNLLPSRIHLSKKNGDAVQIESVIN